MDYAATVTGARQMVQAEQAIFTSIRSPLGEGYRLVAASLGITPDERKELTRRSPSHASLCDDSQRAVGVASYPLSGGRVVVALSMHAGLEHTARGGQRVCTHIVILQPEDFERFACDPLRVRGEVLRRLGSQKALEDSARLLPLELSPAGGADRPVGAPQADQIDRILYVLSKLLSGQRVVLLDVPSPIDIMTSVFQALPLAARRQMSLSIGLKFSPARDHDLLVLGGPLADRQRLQVASGRTLYDWADPPAPATGSHDAWLDHSRRMWSAGREADLADLAARLTERSPAALKQVVTLCEAIERLDHADLAAVRLLLARHACERAVMTVHAELLQQFRAAAQDRVALLEELEAQKAAAIRTED